MKIKFVFSVLLIFTSFCIFAQQQQQQQQQNNNWFFTGETTDTRTSPTDPLGRRINPADPSSGRGTSLTTDPLDRRGGLSADPTANIMLARSSADYRVTAGDVYTLTYAAGTTPVVFVISVDTSYRIRVSNLGVISGEGKTFAQLKSEVESLVTRNFPLSGVQLMLTQPAIFRVFVSGEVLIAGEASAWGLSRLSSLVNENLTDYASTRDVTIRSAGGQVRVYDLFKASRLGDMSQDPFLRPGDVVTFNRLERAISITGAVRRPGIYQILPNENILELINLYGDGFTPLADQARIELVRLVNSENVSGNRLFLSEDEITENFSLEHLDTVSVPFISQLQPVIFVEGAVGDTGAAGSMSTSNRLIVRYFSGETYASLVRRNIDWFSHISDTENAYILRNHVHIPINLNLALYDATFHDRELILEDDVLIIPFRQYFVSVSGAVQNPGRYPYIPDRDWEYYIGLAGGFVPNQNSGNSITIFDMSGKRLKKTEKINPETTIVANTNHFLYFFSQYGPVLTTVLTATGTILQIIILTR